MFYHFNQNNSGGGFDVDTKAGITVNVIVEAPSAAEAVEKAKAIGLYFDGVDAGEDCECCGDRWSIPWNTDGTENPEVYGEPVTEYQPLIRWAGEEPAVAVHYADGRVEFFA